MSETDTIQIRRLADGSYVEVLVDGSTRPALDRTDRERMSNMTEEEIEANALSDPDNPPLTDQQLARMRHPPDVRGIRRTLQMTQVEFAETFEIPLGTLRDWEQLPIVPDRAAASYLRVIESDPEAVIAALHGTVKKIPI